MLKLFHGTSSKRASKIVGNDSHTQEGFRTGDQECVFLAEDAPTARFFASQRTSDESALQHEMGNPDMAPKNLTVIEFTMSLEVANELGLSTDDRRLLGEFSGMPFPDLANSTGHERILVGNQKIAAFNAKLASGEISARREKVQRRQVPNLPPDF